MIVRMWEAKAHPAEFAELLDWVYEAVVPALAAAPGHLGTEVFRSGDERIVVLSRWRDLPAEIAEPPVRLVPRPPHSWDFVPVDRDGA
jgi:heme-degrading monooxygenase HmoA